MDLWYSAIMDESQTNYAQWKKLYHFKKPLKKKTKSDNTK